SVDEASGALRQANALNMLNTRYIILSPDAVPLANDYALGNAWLIERTLIVENADAELEALKTIDPATEAVVDRRFSDFVTVSEAPQASTDTIYLSSYRPNLLIYETNLASDRVAVFSEIYYPKGWQALNDGKPADHFRTDYVLRGMILPAGQHTITFKFEPQSYKTGNRVSMASSLILILMLAFAATSAITAYRKNG
ncbi:MAG: YfhO family protein, partial [Bacteroidales bacterium]|nr:YfhO family protein [Bacteroidales bacterium]